MMKVGEICTREIYVVAPSETAGQAARRMWETGSDVLVILDDKRELVGLLTDRELIVEVVAPKRAPSQVRVRDIMRTDPPSVSVESDVVEALAVMEEVDLRRLPITDERGRLQGVLTVGNLLEMYPGDHVDPQRTIGLDRVRP